MEKIKTYDIKSGVVLILPDGSGTMVFPTEEEAVEYLRELNNEEGSSD